MTELAAKVRELTAGLSSDSADLLTAFHRIQHEYGYVPKEAIPVLASQFRHHAVDALRRARLLL